MVLLARDIAKKIEDELDYPGQIKVNVILRETVPSTTQSKRQRYNAAMAQGCAEAPEGEQEPLVHFQKLMLYQ